MVPKLRENHVLRDSWTQLNVVPAKITQVCVQVHNTMYYNKYVQLYILIKLQQEEVLSELYNHINQQPPPDDKAQVQATLSYLKACSQFFEKGFLSHDQVMSLESDVIKNILNFGVQILFRMA